MHLGLLSLEHATMWRASQRFSRSSRPPSTVYECIVGDGRLGRRFYCLNRTLIRFIKFRSASGSHRSPSTWWKAKFCGHLPTEADLENMARRTKEPDKSQRSCPCTKAYRQVSTYSMPLNSGTPTTSGSLPTLQRLSGLEIQKIIHMFCSFESPDQSVQPVLELQGGLYHPLDIEAQTEKRP